MQEFWLWFQTGFTHIADLNGYDHILFLLVLCVPYGLDQTDKLLWLITAFTFGHSISLALSVMGWVNINSSYVEVLIPLTIVLTALYNIFSFGSNQTLKMPIRYALTGFFGLIHGLGFSYLLRSLLGAGTNLTFPLLSFNLGLEVGQIVIVALIFVMGTILTTVFHFSEILRARVLSGMALLLSLLLLIDRFPNMIKS
jgi:hypothetical protein